MGMTIDDNVDFLNGAKKFFEDIANDPHINESVKIYFVIEALETAIETMRKYQKMQADYENRLKADMVAMLEELQLEIEEQKRDELSYQQTWNHPLNVCISIIQQKINSLGGRENEHI